MGNTCLSRMNDTNPDEMKAIKNQNLEFKTQIRNLNTELEALNKKVKELEITETRNKDEKEKLEIEIKQKDIIIQKLQSAQVNESNKINDDSNETTRLLTIETQKNSHDNTTRRNDDNDEKHKQVELELLSQINELNERIKALQTENDILLEKEAKLKHSLYELYNCRYQIATYICQIIPETHLNIQKIDSSDHVENHLNNTDKIKADNLAIEKSMQDIKYKYLEQKDELSNITKTIEKLTLEANDLKLMLDSKVNEGNNTKTILETKLNEANNQIKQLNEQLEKQSKSFLVYKEKMKQEFQARLTAINDNKDELLKKIEGLKELMAAQIEDNQQLSKQLEEKKTEYTKLEEDYQLLENDYDALEKKAFELQSQLKETEDEKQKSDHNKEKELKNIQSLYEKVSHELKESQTKNKFLEYENENLKTKNEKLEQEIEKRKHEQTNK